MNSTITDEQLKEILNGCENVTPGPWQVYDGCSWRRIGTEPGRGQYDTAVLAPCVAPDGHPDLTSSAGDREANLAHFARLDPATVAAMASELLAAREALRPRRGYWSADIPPGKPTTGPVEAIWVDDPNSPFVRPEGALSGNRSGN